MVTEYKLLNSSPERAPYGSIEEYTFKLDGDSYNDGRYIPMFLD